MCTILFTNWVHISANACSHVVLWQTLLCPLILAPFVIVIPSLLHPYSRYKRSHGLSYWVNTTHVEKLELHLWFSLTHPCKKIKFYTDCKNWYSIQLTIQIPIIYIFDSISEFTRVPDPTRKPGFFYFWRVGFFSLKTRVPVGF